MIRSLRGRHRLWARVLLVAGPLVILGSLAARPEASQWVVATLPGAPHQPMGAGAVLDSAFPMAVDLTADSAGLVVTVSPRTAVRTADPLLYLSPVAARVGDTSLPAGGIMVGPAGGERITRDRVPAPPTPPGYAVLWSNAHRRVEAVAALRGSASR